MAASVSRLFLWAVLALMGVVMWPAALRSLGAESEEAESEEPVCTSVIAHVGVRLRRILVPSPLPRVFSALCDWDSRLRALPKAHSYSHRGHMLPNGLNAPLLT
jgi:hypothetical protein